MDNTKGWVKLWRKSFKNPMYFEEPFTKWQAWVDLIMLADESGHLKTSGKWLKTRWKWRSDDKVIGHLRSLERAGMLTLNRSRFGTEINISKYWAYQNNFSDKNEPNRSRNRSENRSGNRAQEDTSIKEVRHPKDCLNGSFDAKEKNNIYGELNMESFDDE